MNGRNFSLQQGIRASLCSLLIVAFLGVIMRYKISWSLPFIDQKNFLHAHSHFAFSGWITMALMVLLVGHLVKKTGAQIINRYKWVLVANLATAYGMLFTFPVQGYGLYSIIFSTLSIFVSWVFAFMYWRDLNRASEKNISTHWFKAALLFNIISSIGAFSLAGMMATKNIHQNWYLQAVYFFLHFQYNGWFFFACMGLLAEKLSGYSVASKNLKIIFWLFATACIPAYILSVLWVDIPFWAYIIVVLSAFAQLAAWGMMVRLIYRLPAFTAGFRYPAKQLLLLSGIALTIKLLLQTGSTIPFLSHLAYGFRPIVIAYLHLVLLGVITMFIIGYIIESGLIILSRKSIAGILMFTSGVILNEMALMVQGIGNLYYTNVPHINHILFWVAVLMFTGLLLICLSQRKITSGTDPDHTL